MCVCDFCGKKCLKFEYVVRCKKCNVSYAHLTCLDDLNVDNFTCTSCMQSILPFHELDNKNFEELFLHQIPLLNKITDKRTDSIRDADYGHAGMPRMPAYLTTTL